MPDDAVPLADLKRALVVKLRHHGDVLLASPVFQVLKNHAPQLEIDALVYADTAPMLSLHPAIDRLHAIDRGWKALGPLARLAREWALLRSLRARRYDLLVHLTQHRRGAWLARWLAPRYAVAPRDPAGGTAWARSFSHLYSRPGPTWRHTVEMNLDALRRIGLQPDAGERALRLVPGAEAEARIGALLAGHGIAAGSFIHLHPASRWPFKCWPAAHNAALADALAGPGRPVVLTAAPDPAETGFVADIAARCARPPVDLSGQLSLKELAALTARARLFVGVDSAPMHIAAAMGTPTVALFGPSGEGEWGPWSPRAIVVASDRHPCRPCGIDGCGGGKVSECLTTLPVAQVRAACEKLLAP